MAIVQVAWIQNDTIANVGDFEEEGLDDLLALFQPFFPDTEFVRMSDLPPEVRIFWVRVNGVWTDPNAPVDPPEEEGE